MGTGYNDSGGGAPSGNQTRDSLAAGKQTTALCSLSVQVYDEAHIYE